MYETTLSQQKAEQQVKKLTFPSRKQWLGSDWDWQGAQLCTLAQKLSPRLSGKSAPRTTLAALIPHGPTRGAHIAHNS